MGFALNFANSLWNGGHFYAAVMVLLPFQVGYVLANNLPIWFVLCIGNSYGKRG